MLVGMSILIGDRTGMEGRISIYTYVRALVSTRPQGVPPGFFSHGAGPLSKVKT